MAHPDHHSESSARKFGGQPSDYHAVHDWMDVPKAHEALPIHRAIRHHSFGIFDAQRVFGRFLPLFVPWVLVLFFSLASGFGCRVGFLFRRELVFS